MNRKTWLLGATAAVAFGAIGTTAHSAPLSIMQVDRATQNSVVQDVVWVRRCYWHRGHRHCRRVWLRDYGYYDDPYYYGSPYGYGPYAYGPYAYGPSFGFFFGGRGGHHHHGRR